MTNPTYRTAFVTTADGGTAWISPTRLAGHGLAPHGFAALPAPVNENLAEIEQPLFPQLPQEIRVAVDEWAQHLSLQEWRLRRRAILRFAQCFADNFLALQPELSDEEYDSLHDIGLSCILERLDDGKPITDIHQARIYKESVHDIHQARAEAYLAAQAPTQATLH